MIDLTAVTAALAADGDIIAAIREATGYTLEQLSVVSGLADVEIAELEVGAADASKLTRLLSALGLPPTA